MVPSLKSKSSASESSEREHIVNSMGRSGPGVLRYQEARFARKLREECEGAELSIFYRWLEVL